MIEIDKYPRPTFDTRVCFHGTANQYDPWGLDLRYWLQEVKDMGGSWCKGLSDRDGDTGLAWAPIVLEMGMMPVVRIYQSMPWLLDDTIKRAIDRLVAAGVHYIETLNEPDNQQEWDVPSNWADIAAQNQIDVARYIQQAGGIPLIASLSTGSPESYVDMTKKILQWGGGDIYAGKFVMSIHNYPLNHPIGIEAYGQSDTYPLDTVNQEGAPVSQELYDKIGGFGWQNRSREWVNDFREERKNPGDGMFDDNCGEINLFYVAECAKRTLEAEITDWEGYPPCIVTEGGLVIGDCQDGRYPCNTPEYHRDANLELARRCMGTSTEHSGKHNYPGFVLAGCGYWLLHNYGGAINWNSQAWYGGHWPENFRNGDRLWIVDTLKAEPKVAYGDPLPPPEPLPPDPEPPPEPPPSGVVLEVPQVWIDRGIIGVDVPFVEHGDEFWAARLVQWHRGDPHVIEFTVEDIDGVPIPWAVVEVENGGITTCTAKADRPGEFPMYGMVGSYSIKVLNGKSDVVRGLGLGIPETWELGYKEHAGFRVIFRREVAGTDPIPEPPPEPPPGDIPDIEDISDTLEKHPTKTYEGRSLNDIDEIIMHQRV